MSIHEAECLCGLRFLRDCMDQKKCYYCRTYGDRRMHLSQVTEEGRDSNPQEEPDHEKDDDDPGHDSGRSGPDGVR